MEKKDLSYDSSAISELTDLLPIRINPSMYIGSTSSTSTNGNSGIGQLLYEILDNSIDEYLVGYGKNIWIYVNKDDYVTVVDEARGIPCSLSDTIRDNNGNLMNTLTAVCTKMNAGGKFRGRGSAYRFSSGLHGIGLKASNVLSESMSVTVKRDGKIYQQKFSRGVPLTDVEIIGETNETGTTVKYKPDIEIFKNGISMDNNIQRRLMELASLNAGIAIHYKNEKTKQNITYCFEKGIAGLVETMIENKPKLFDDIFHFQGEYNYVTTSFDKDGRMTEEGEDTIFCDIAFIYTDESEQSGKIKVFANNINTYEGGTHLIGFKNIIKTKMNEYALQRKLTKKPVELMYWLDGLYAVVSVKISNPEFESQTKIKLNNSEAQDAVEKVVGDYFDKLFKDKSKQPILDAIAQHAIRVKEAEEAARRAKAIKRTSKAASKQALPGKLADCANADSANYSEVYLVEGQSSAGCVHGDTLIHLADGRDVSIEQLVEEFNQKKKNYVFSMNTDTNDITVQPIQNAFCTKEVTELIEITLDNGEIIQCTPEHPFLCANGNYVEAKDLVVGKSLMPLYSKISGSAKVYNAPINESRSKRGYEYIVIHGKYVPVHRLVANQYYGKKEKGFHTHHIDINSRNNNPENLQYLPKSEHLALHMNLINDEYHYNFGSCSEKFHRAAIEASIVARKEHPEWEEKHKKNLKKYHDEHPEWKENLSIKAKEQWEDEELRAWRAEKTREQLKEQKESGEIVQIMQKRKETFNKHTIERFKQYVLFLKETYSIIPNTRRLYRLHMEEYNQGKDKRTMAPRWESMHRILLDDEINEILDTINHQIVSIKYITLDEPVKVYDLTVPPYNNFALSSGVFVHNSAKTGRQPAFQAILPLRGKVLNVEKVTIDKMLKAPSVQTIISALGCGVGKTFDVTKCRYDKILLATDADVDG